MLEKNPVFHIASLVFLFFTIDLGVNNSIQCLPGEAETPSSGCSWACPWLWVQSFRCQWSLSIFFPSFSSAPVNSVSDYSPSNKFPSHLNYAKHISLIIAKNTDWYKGYQYFYF